MSHLYIAVEDARTHQPLPPDRMHIVQEQIRFALRGLDVSVRVDTVA